MTIKREASRSGQYERLSSGVLRVGTPWSDSEFQGSIGSGPTTASPGIEGDLLRILGKYVGEIMARSIVIHASKMCCISLSRLRSGDAEKLLTQLEKAMRLYVQSPLGRKDCIEEVTALLRTTKGVSAAEQRHVVPISTEADIVTARNVGRDMCKALGFSVTGQTRVATAISELTRNIVLYTSGGTLELASLESPRRGIEILAKDSGTGIPNLDDILAGRYVSPTGMGKGLAGTRQLMDSFVVRTGSSGTEIRAVKYLAPGESRTQSAAR